jgi:hypothetical protein
MTWRPPRVSATGALAVNNLAQMMPLWFAATQSLAYLGARVVERRHRSIIGGKRSAI